MKDLIEINTVTVTYNSTTQTILTITYFEHNSAIPHICYVPHNRGYLDKQDLILTAIYALRRNGCKPKILSVDEFGNIFYNIMLLDVSRTYATTEIQLYLL